MIPPKDPIEYLSALSLRLYADNSALLSLSVSIALHVGLTELDGVPLQQWYEQKRRGFAQKILLQIENDDPSAAAALQKVVDDFQWPTF